MSDQQLTKDNLIRMLGFVSEDERTQLEKLAYEYMDSGILVSNPVGPYRFNCKVYGTKYCTQLISDLGDRVSKRLGLDNYAVDPYLGYVISLIQPGGYIHEHVDRYGSYMEGMRHLRCNIMVRRENETYDPIISHMIVPVPQCAAWGFIASECKHGTQHITGNDARIIFGFGWTVPSHYTLETFQS